MARKQQDLITVTEAAKLLGITRQGVWKAIKRGRLNARHFGRFVLIPQESLKAYKPVMGRPKKKR